MTPTMTPTPRSLPSWWTSSSTTATRFTSLSSLSMAKVRAWMGRWWPCSRYSRLVGEDEGQCTRVLRYWSILLPLLGDVWRGILGTVLYRLHQSSHAPDADKVRALQSQNENVLFGHSVTLVPVAVLTRKFKILGNLGEFWLIQGPVANRDT